FVAKVRREHADLVAALGVPPRERAADGLADALADRGGVADVPARGERAQRDAAELRVRVQLAERDPPAIARALAGVAGVERAAEDRAFERPPIEPADDGEVLRRGLRAALLALVHALLGGEAAAVQTGHDVAAIGEIAGIAEHPGADLAPRRGQDAVLGLGAMHAEIRGG